MNVALPALVIFFIFLPGFIFRIRFKRVERTSLDFSPFGRIAAGAVMSAAVAHLLWLSFTYWLFGQRFEPIVLMQLLSSAPASQVAAASAVAADFSWIAAYFGTLLFASFAFPILLRSAITNYRLDRASSPLRPMLRFHEAPWYYLLTGADFPEEEAPDFVIVAAIVEVGRDAMLYTGVLDSFFFDSDGQLDRLVLQGVARRPLARDKDTSDDEAEDKAASAGRADTGRFYPVDGDSFVLRYSEMITLNVQYVHLG
ncbi:hypothetical protein [Pseudoduganella albidiflava]|uniref:Uncharacterized protein n=1 Tax=Pseudoduganella albidiflava TaxID=321983 RepID=A0A411X3N6_9BURK|nr:hypothetical protein [Pseudoduganella albidiflava]QBI03600.1 hypothetical protein EYF70_24305 [Pseudoduganella albidiflava]GGY51328.1 hypothetical protein GCM10007387_37150 [Pseudoduganella albidiflava]